MVHRKGIFDASGTLFSALLHVTSWNVTPANSGVRTLRRCPARARPGRVAGTDGGSAASSTTSFWPSHRMHPVEHVFYRLSTVSTGRARLGSGRDHPRPQVVFRRRPRGCVRVDLLARPDVLHLVGCAVLAHEPHERDAPTVGVPDLLAELGGTGGHLDRDAPGAQPRRHLV